MEAARLQKHVAQVALQGEAVLAVLRRVLRHGLVVDGVDPAEQAPAPVAHGAREALRRGAVPAEHLHAPLICSLIRGILLGGSGLRVGAPLALGEERRRGAVGAFEAVLEDDPGGLLRQGLVGLPEQVADDEDALVDGGTLWRTERGDAAISLRARARVEEPHRTVVAQDAQLFSTRRQVVDGQVAVHEEAAERRPEDHLRGDALARGPRGLDEVLQHLAQAVALQLVELDSSGVVRLRRVPAQLRLQGVDVEGGEAYRLLDVEVGARRQRLPRDAREVGPGLTLAQRIIGAAGREAHVQLVVLVLEKVEEQAGLALLHMINKASLSFPFGPLLHQLTLEGLVALQGAEGRDGRREGRGDVVLLIPRPPPPLAAGGLPRALARRLLTRLRGRRPGPLVGPSRHAAVAAPALGRPGPAGLSLAVSAGPTPSQTARAPRHGEVLQQLSFGAVIAAKARRSPAQPSR
mmetsp:Transcript_33106/g.84569  ORF Transcript_33106/g.84569 Transcript_33106/m.84569 type:complete len:464 (+) Transcript_33106:2442-3833(+)